MQDNTRRIIKLDLDHILAYEKVFDVEMPKVDENGCISNLPAPFPRIVHGIERSGYRITELGRTAKKSGIPVMNPILGRHSAEETFYESKKMYEVAEELCVRLFHFVHSEATRHIDPLDGEELINQSRGKGGITPRGEREFIHLGGGSVHPLRINATGDTPHLSILNALIAGFDGTDIGPTIHVHFGGRGIQDYRTKVNNGYKALQICAENNIFTQVDSHKHLNNIGGTDGMALAMCLLSESLAIHAGLPSELSAIQMNVAGINILADLAVMKAFREVIFSEFLIVVPETFQNPPADLIAEQAHFARMAVSAKLGGANFYRPKAAEAVGIPTGDSMAKAIWASQNIFENTAKVTINDSYIEKRKNEIHEEALAVLTSVFNLKKHLRLKDITPEFWLKYSPNDLIDSIVYAGKAGILDAPKAGGWDLKRAVKTHRDKDGIRRYIKGYSPMQVDPSALSYTVEKVKVFEETKPSRPEKIVLATVGADAHVLGINLIQEALSTAGWEVIYLRGMNLPETVAEVVAETGAKVVGVSNLLGMGIELFPRVGKRLEQLGIRKKVIVMAGGRISEKEEEHVAIDSRIMNDGPDFLGVDGFFGPGTDVGEIISWLDSQLEDNKNGTN